MKNDIKMIHEDLWNFFHKIYGGGPKLCYNQSTTKKNEKIEPRNKYSHNNINNNIKKEILTSTSSIQDVNQ